MRSGKRFVCVSAEHKVNEVVQLVSAAKTGAAIIVNERAQLVGIFTDGDLRRAVLQGGDVLRTNVSKYASIPCASIKTESSVADALLVLRERHIEDLPVVEASTGHVVGLLCLKDIASL